ncbi:MAG: hypothetical protein ACRYGG_11455 [Janthinobacterium lividum]
MYQITNDAYELWLKSLKAPVSQSLNTKINYLTYPAINFKDGTGQINIQSTNILQYTGISLNPQLTLPWEISFILKCNGTSSLSDDISLVLANGASDQIFNIDKSLDPYFDFILRGNGSIGNNVSGYKKTKTLYGQNQIITIREIELGKYNIYENLNLLLTLELNQQPSKWITFFSANKSDWNIQLVKSPIYLV